MIRAAILDDAEQAIDVIRRSIQELCLSDHRGEEDVLQMWLENKTAENFRLWLGLGNQRILVAEQDGKISAVGGASRRGEIMLNYIAPNARFRGVSKTMLVALEQYLADEGHDRITLTSTETARRFYRSRGYVDAGVPEFWGKLPGYPMAKLLKGRPGR